MTLGILFLVLGFSMIIGISFNIIKFFYIVPKLLIWIVGIMGFILAGIMILYGIELLINIK